jgi:hypothetical protein
MKSGFKAVQLCTRPNPGFQDITIENRGPEVNFQGKKP